MVPNWGVHHIAPTPVIENTPGDGRRGTPARFVIVDDGWQEVTPDAAYRKKEDHISDHDYGVALRERRTAKEGRIERAIETEPRGLFRQKRTSLTPSKAQTSANGGPGGRTAVESAERISAQNASPGAPENASPAPSSRSSPERDANDISYVFGETAKAGAAAGKTTRLARVTRSAAAAYPLRRLPTFSRAKSRLRQSVSNLASTEVPAATTASRTEDGHRAGRRADRRLAAPYLRSRASQRERGGDARGARRPHGMASGLEAAYWHGVHSSPYLGVSWRWFRFLGQGVLSDP